MKMKNKEFLLKPIKLFNWFLIITAFPSVKTNIFFEILYNISNIFVEDHVILNKNKKYTGLVKKKPMAIKNIERKFNTFLLKNYYDEYLSCIIYNDIDNYCFDIFLPMTDYFYENNKNPYNYLIFLKNFFYFIDEGWLKKKFSFNMAIVFLEVYINFSGLDSKRIVLFFDKLFKQYGKNYDFFYYFFLGFMKKLVEINDEIILNNILSIFLNSNNKIFNEFNSFFMLLMALKYKKINFIKKLSTFSVINNNLMYYNLLTIENYYSLNKFLIFKHQFYKILFCFNKKHTFYI